MYQLLRNLLFCLDAETAHGLTQRLLRLFFPACLAKRFQPKNPDTPLQVFGLSFPNRIGIAAGWDKNGECIDQLFGLGFGFVEVGTVTPKPQAGNPRPRLFRLKDYDAIINRMGFNNKGVDRLVENLKKRKLPGIIGVNIGKNKITPNEQAFEDYLICLNKVYPYADYITINISSPNTPGLRDLHAAEALDHLLQQLTDARKNLQSEHQKQVPLLVKLSPDLSTSELQTTIELLLKHEIDGVIATNTTVSRDRVKDHPLAKEQGGLSGRPVQSQARLMVAAIHEMAGDRLPIIGVGGIDSTASANSLFAAGAGLLQVYTGLIYRGPTLIRKLAAAHTV